MMTWTEKLQALFELQGEAYTGTGPVSVDGQTNVPYFDQGDAEQVLYEVHLQLLREVPPPDLEACGSTAVVTATFTGVGTLPQNLIDILGAKIAMSSGGTPMPAVELLPVAFIQNSIGGIPACYSIFSGQLRFSGFSCTIVQLLEPALSDFQANAVILPDGYDQDAITLAHQLLEISDYLPEGRL